MNETADDERLAVIQDMAFRAVRHVNLYGDRLDSDELRRVLGEAFDCGAATAAAERDALQARIEAAKAVFADADVLDETALSMSAALAGDQPEATWGDQYPEAGIPQPEAEKRPIPGGFCMECGFDCINPGHAAPEATPEPPHLDPFPWVLPDGERSRHSLTFGIVCRFDPRPADENGKAYSKNRAHYEGGTA